MEMKYIGAVSLLLRVAREVGSNNDESNYCILAAAKDLLEELPGRFRIMNENSPGNWSLEPIYEKESKGARK
jgi:hypothetical protein